MDSSEVGTIAAAETLAEEKIHEVARVPVDSSSASLAEQAKVPSSSSLPETSTAPSATDIVVRVELICGGITNVEAPVAIAARYDRLPLAGGRRHSTVSSTAG